MNYKELRVGNYVFVDHRETAVTAIDLLVLSQNERLRIDEDVIAPMFLSESLLFRLGFIVEFDKTPYRVYSKNGFLLCSNENKTYNFYVGQSSVGKDIAYLHQLQNLYFLICGCELDYEDSDGEKKIYHNKKLGGFFDL